MKGSVLAFAAVFTLCLAGCSSDPSASDFEAFAREYATDASQIKQTRKGKPIDVTVTLVSHDLRKTDSLTSPFVGVANYSVVVNSIDIAHSQVPGYAAKGSFTSNSTVEFRWADKQWQPVGGTAVIVDSRLIDQSEAVTDKIGRIDADNRDNLTAQDVQEKRIYLLSGWAEATPDMFKKN